MSYRLSGINPLAYVGVEPLTPPAMLVYPRSPTPGDSKGYNLGSLWLVAAPPPTTNWELWLLVDLTAGVATWVQIYPDSGAGVIRLDADVGFAIPTLGVINVLGGPNINTFGDASNNLFINLNESIRLPNTSSDGSQGVLFLGAVGGVGGQTFLHNYGTGNTFTGTLAGNLTLNVGAAQDNSGYGDGVLNSLTDGAFNTAVGSLSQRFVTAGNLNSSLGATSLLNLVSGSNNLALGEGAGENYTGAESSNIMIANPGVLGESNTIRIGVDGVGLGQQDAAYMAGVYGRSVGGTNQTVVIDNAGKLGSVVSPPPISNAAKAFLGILETDTGIVTGLGATYVLGTTVAYTTVFDDTGGFFPGDGLGTPASFTAPVTGKYYLEVQVLPLDTSGGTSVAVWPQIDIITPSRTYTNNGAGGGGSIGGIIRSTLPVRQAASIFNVVADLSIGDVVTYQITANYGSNNLIIRGSSSPLTLLTGFLIASQSAVTGSGTIITTFDASGTWFKDPSTKLVKVVIWNGGSGGGSGAQGLTFVSPQSSTGGGGGASCGVVVTDQILESFFNPSESVIIGAGGTGGASQLAPNTPGNPGNVGGLSSFANLGLNLNPATTYVGGGGLLNNVISGNAPNTTNLVYNYGNSFTGFVNTAGNVAGVVGSGRANTGNNGLGIGGLPGVLGGTITSLWSGTEGGGGGGADNTTAWAGGNGGPINNVAFNPGVTVLVAGGAGGIETGTINGSNGADFPLNSGTFWAGGTGGGGGGGQSTGLVAGNGGNGGIPGAGGGGGGASLNGTPSGAGGNGARGKVIVIEYL